MDGRVKMNRSAARFCCSLVGSKVNPAAPIDPDTPKLSTNSKDEEYTEYPAANSALPGDEKGAVLLYDAIPNIVPVGILISRLLDPSRGSKATS
mmetsp:Transcript_6982/g.20939  ORF Transcript_6982/g.20939 Transcript_6982/m.20939 type:complete len:94 (+) Transcript_6982:621-902(+)